jgi:outer membrane protein assembly factor BamE
MKTYSLKPSLKYCMYPYRFPLFILLSLGLLGAGCSYRPTLSVPNAIKPYKPEIVQGNFVSKEQVAALRSGMNKAQARNILGTPLLTDLFHSERWDYVFTIEKDGKAAAPKRLTLFFQGDSLDKWEGDEMPSETEFVSSLSSGRTIGKVPPLQATEKQLNDFAAKENPKNTTPIAPSVRNVPAAPKEYPPLEAK